MKITGEATMSVDAQRKVWVSVSGEVDIDDPNAGKALEFLAAAAAKAATKAYDHALARMQGMPTEEEEEEYTPAMGTPGGPPLPEVPSG